MGQVQADLQVFTLPQTLAWSRTFQHILLYNLTVVKLHLNLNQNEAEGQNEDHMCPPCKLCATLPVDTTCQTSS